MPEVIAVVVLTICLASVTCGHVHVFWRDRS